VKNPELSQTQNYGLAHYADPIRLLKRMLNENEKIIGCRFVSNFVFGQK
jgi:hypothetical protein